MVLQLNKRWPSSAISQVFMSSHLVFYENDFQKTNNRCTVRIILFVNFYRGRRNPDVDVLLNKGLKIWIINIRIAKFLFPICLHEKLKIGCVRKKTFIIILSQEMQKTFISFYEQNNNIIINIPAKMLFTEISFLSSVR